MSTPSIRLFLVDDHPIVRSGLLAILATEADFDVVGSAATGSDASTQILALVPDVALVDLRLALGSGFQVIADVTAARLTTRVLVLTTYDDVASINQALEAGASGYLLKDVPSEQLFSAIRRVARGQQVLSSEVQHRLASDTLSARELEVLRWAAQGESNRAIAKRLFISEATVKTHLLHIFSKLGQSQRTAAVTEALRRGLIRLDGT
jgi:DNA-binding NarL/FixJ family response regulator